MSVPPGPERAEAAPPITLQLMEGRLLRSNSPNLSPTDLVKLSGWLSTYNALRETTRTRLGPDFEGEITPQLIAQYNGGLPSTAMEKEKRAERAAHHAESKHFSFPERF